MKDLAESKKQKCRNAEMQKAESRKQKAKSRKQKWPGSSGRFSQFQLSPSLRSQPSALKIAGNSAEASFTPQPMIYEDPE
jgi:hypothetical protein